MTSACRTMWALEICETLFEQLAAEARDIQIVVFEEQVLRINAGLIVAEVRGIVGRLRHSFRLEVAEYNKTDA